MHHNVHLQESPVVLDQIVELQILVEELLLAVVRFGHHFALA